MSKILNFIKDIISPKYCYSCKEEWHFLCQKCLSTMDNFKEFCFVCKKPSYQFEVNKECSKDIYYDKIIILTHYKNIIIKKLIKNSKFYWKKDILEDFWLYLSTILFKNEDILNSNEYILVPAPMFFLRKFIRWYNHSEILSKIVSSNTKLLQNTNIIKKVRHTRQQSKLTKVWRENNLKWVFKINDDLIDYIRWKKIIVVDDVVSTWTTINEIAKVLKDNWVDKVIWLVIASD